MWIQGLKDQPGDGAAGWRSDDEFMSHISACTLLSKKSKDALSPTSHSQRLCVQSIDPGQQFTWEHSNLEVNKPKNRYANVIAYDHSRVILTPVDGEKQAVVDLHFLICCHLFLFAHYVQLCFLLKEFQVVTI